MPGHGQCPFCGLIVIKDDAALEVLHEEPVCARFTAMATVAGPHEVSRVRAENVDAHLVEARAAVRARRN